MINDKNRYRGSLLAQSILKEKVTRTVTKDEMLETVNLDYRRLIIIQLVSIAFGGRAKTTEGMVVLGKLPDGIFTLLRFNDEGGQLTHISESEALWLTLELAPEKMDCI